MSAAEGAGETGQVGEVEQVALDLASSVFGWQHLARYSGMSADWMDLTLLAIVRSALAAQERVSRPGQPTAEPAPTPAPVAGGEAT